jgi:pimeloyl-ACP methyl ester carboxylesterase
MRLIFLAAFFASQISWGGPPSDEFMRSFQTSRVQFPSENSDYAKVNPGRYPSWLLWLFDHPFNWNPLGEKSDYPEKCGPDDLFESLKETASAPEQAARIDDHKVRCGKSFQNGSTWSAVNGIKIMSMGLDIHHHALLHRVVFHLPGGVRLKGLLALKGDYKKRPFVVLRLGIYSNVEEFLPERYLLMQLFEQGVANMLVLENMTSADFIANNAKYSLGGYNEGIQNIQVARILRSGAEPLSQLISSLHFVGVSLGGHGVLFASLLNEYNKKPIQSFTGICPVVNLKDTMNSLARPNILGVGADYWSSLRLEGLKNRDPLLDDYGVSDLFKFKPIFLPRAMKWVTEQFEKNPIPIGSIELPPAPYSNKTFWQANDFWTAYRNVASPVLVVGTVNDAMVSPAENIFWLKGKSRAWNSNIGVVVFEEGFHCTLPIAYDWASIASLFNGRIMAYDQNTRISYRNASVEVADNFDEDISEIHDLKFTLGWANENKDVILKVNSEKHERISFTTTIPVEQLDFKFHEPLKDPEKLSVERWLNHNLDIKLVKEGSKIKAQLRFPVVL